MFGETTAGAAPTWAGALRGVSRTRHYGSQGSLRAARRAGRTFGLLQPGNALLRRFVARRLRQILSRPPRLYGWLAPGRQNAAASRWPTTAGPFVYRGFYRFGKRVIFAYRLAAKNARFSLGREWQVRPCRRAGQQASTERLPCRVVPLNGRRSSTVQGKLGTNEPYAVDTIPLPFDNPWKSPLFIGDHDFLPDGRAMVCTMQGDVWRVTGLDDKLRAGAMAPIRFGPAPTVRAGYSRWPGLCAGPGSDNTVARSQSMTARPTSTSASATGWLRRRRDTTTRAG